MSCLCPQWMLNPTYKKNPEQLLLMPQMPHDLYIQVDCTKCINCRRKRANDWRVRLTHELYYGRKNLPYFRAEFVTLTFAPEHYERFREEPERAIRLFLERFRKKYKRSLRHWFVTELGGEHGRLHFHGVIINYPFEISERAFERYVTPKNLVGKPIPGTNKRYKKYGAFKYNDGKLTEYVNDLKSLWQYGNVWIDCVRPETVNYIVKYITKDPEPIDVLFEDDEFVKTWKPRVFVSPGLGRSYTEDKNVIDFHKQNLQGVWYCLFDVPGGKTVKYAMPRYYIDKIFEKSYRRTLSFLRWLSPPQFSKYLNGVHYTDENLYHSARISLYQDSLRRGTSSPIKLYNVYQLPFELVAAWIQQAAKLSERYLNAVMNVLARFTIMTAEQLKEHYKFLYDGTSSSIKIKCA